MKKINKLLNLLTCLCLVSCGDATSSFTSNNDVSSFISTKGVTNLLKNAKDPIKITRDPTKNEEFKMFLDKFVDFSLKFNDSFLNRYDDKNANVAISPLSLFFALAMASECTANNSQEEILNALNMTTSELRENLSILYGLENTTSYSYDVEKNEDVIKSIKNINNSLWFNKEVNKLDNTLNNLANYYFTDSYETDFLNQNEKANQDFRNYVKDKTRGLIDKNFNLDPSTLLVLLNTFYLKDVWDEMGDELSLTDTYYNFNSRLQDYSVKTKLMKGYYVNGRVLHTDTYSSFFTTTSSNLKLHFLIPNDNYDLENVFIKENIDNILDLTNYEYRNEDIKTEYFTSTLFPSFEATCDEDLTPLLHEDFRINDIFTDASDFSNISTDDMYVKQVIHSTKLKVDQVGIEGAAITALITATSTMPEYEKVYETFVIDKSFGYILTDSFGVPLFSGVVNNIKN